MRAICAVGCVVGLGLLPAVAIAGPIPFVVGIESLAQPDANGGAGHFSIVDPGNRPPATSPPDGPLTLVNVTLTPRAPADPTWVQGTAQVAIGETPFSIDLSFTDVLSGETGTITVSGAARSEWLHTAEGPMNLTGAWINFDPIADGLVLGVNRYDVLTSGAGGVDGGLTGTVRFTVDLNSTPIPLPPPPQGSLDTPEPGTLALAGIGLAAAGGFIRRRRVR